MFALNNVNLQIQDVNSDVNIVLYPQPSTCINLRFSHPFNIRQPENWYFCYCNSGYEIFFDIVNI